MPSGRRWVGASAALANACTPHTHTHTHARAHTRTHPRACVAFRSEDGPNAPTAFAALVVVPRKLKRTHPRACVAFRSEVDWGQRGVAVKASAVGVVRWQTHARRSVRIFTAITFVI